MKAVLDVCCGARSMWFDPKDTRAIFVDNRRERYVIDKGTHGTIGRKDCVIAPDVQADFTNLPFPDNTFSLVVMDPPHVIRLEALGIITKKYGVLIAGWEEMLHAGFAECFRVLKPGGTLIFKWCEVQVPLSRVLALTSEKPLFGHRSGKKSKTHWCAFLKSGSISAAGEGGSPSVSQQNRSAAETTCGSVPAGEAVASQVSIPESAEPQPFTKDEK